MVNDGAGTAQLCGFLDSKKIRSSSIMLKVSFVVIYK